MKIAKQTITPAIAQEMLKKNTNNRPLTEEHVARLARAMSEGQWQFNGDTICLNGDRLIDGQHRLHAVIKSGVPIETIVVEGVPSESFTTKDVGKRRSAGDVLGIRGEKNACLVAAAVALVSYYFTGQIVSRNRIRYTNDDIVNLLHEHPGVRESVRVASRGNTTLMPSSAMVALHYLFAMKDKQMADVFITKLIDGKDIADSDAVYFLRERLMKNSASLAKLPKPVLIALTIKAWNAYRKGTAIKVLKFELKRGDMDGETFPIIQ